MKGWWKEVLTQEEILWHQKSRTQWLQCGGRNTKYFHLSTLIRRRKNRVELLQKEDGSWASEQEDLTDMALTYYRRLYESDPESDGNFLTGCFPRLPMLSLEQLRRDFTKEEVHEALKGMGSLKASTRRHGV